VIEPDLFNAKQIRRDLGELLFENKSFYGRVLFPKIRYLQECFIVRAPLT
jgi:hypothetical protein